MSFSLFKSQLLLITFLPSLGCGSLCDDITAPLEPNEITQGLVGRTISVPDDISLLGMISSETSCPDDGTSLSIWKTSSLISTSLEALYELRFSAEFVEQTPVGRYEIPLDAGSYLVCAQPVGGWCVAVDISSGTVITANLVNSLGSNIFAFNNETGAALDSLDTWMPSALEECLLAAESSADSDEEGARPLEDDCFDEARAERAE